MGEPVAQVKVFTEQMFIEIACEQFLGKSVRDIRQVLQMTLEGHLRAILGTMTVEGSYQDREQFASLVREVASPDFGRMGFEIVSFVIVDIFDHVNYLDSLGKSVTAQVKKDAAIGVAAAERDAGIKISGGQRMMMGVRYEIDTKIANFAREYEMQKAQFAIEVNTKTAEAQMAYELQAAKEEQGIRKEEIQIEIVERGKRITIQEKEVSRVEKELVGTVHIPADALAYQLETVAQGAFLMPKFLRHYSTTTITKPFNNLSKSTNKSIWDIHCGEIA